MPYKWISSSSPNPAYHYSLPSLLDSISVSTQLSRSIFGWTSKPWCPFRLSVPSQTPDCLQCFPQNYIFNHIIRTGVFWRFCISVIYGLVISWLNRVTIMDCTGCQSDKAVLTKSPQLVYQSHLFLKMFLLKPFSAIMLVVTLSICVKAETHTVVFTNKCVVLLTRSLILFHWWGN